jgi:predicted amidohydrolase
MLKDACMIRVALIQFAPSFLEKEKTIQELENLFPEVADADIVVLPELTNSGYDFSDFKQAFYASESIAKSSFIEFLAEKAKQNNQYIVSGFNEREGRRIYNSSVITGPKGYIGVYRKLHLFMREKEFFTPGNLGLPVFDLGFARIGMLICFDWMFPEVWRILAQKGADIICHPSNLVLPYAQQAVPVHCMINRVFAITCNRVGIEGNLKFTGKSIVADTKGNVLHESSSNRTEVFAADLDIKASRDKMITPFNHIFNDIRCRSYEMKV